VQKRIRRELATMSPLKLLAEGRMVREFVDGLNLYIGRIEGDRLQDVRIWDSREAGMVREITARSGSIQTNVVGGGMQVNLKDVTISPLRPDMPGRVSCEQWIIQIPTVDAGFGTGARRPFYMTLNELRQSLEELRRRPPAEIAPAERERKAMEIKVEMNKRFVLSASCLAFVFLGVPLGIRAHRKESSIGVAMSLLLVFAFYLFVIAAESLNRHPEWRPDLIVWLPVVLAVGIGARLTRRSD
jgi:lipopolysaccharide export system permease protein